MSKKYWASLAVQTAIIAKDYPRCGAINSAKKFRGIDAYRR